LPEDGSALWLSRPGHPMTPDGLRIAAGLDVGRLRRWGLALFLAESLAFLVLSCATHGLLGPMRTPSSTDFVSFYAAGHLANLGLASLVYNQDIHQSAVREIFGDPALPYYYFFYPPVFLLLCQILARLPYLVAFSAWAMGTAAFAYAAIRRILPDRRYFWPFASFPCLFWTLGLGQNSLLTAGLIGFATLALDRRPAVGGALLALIAYKPHFLLLVPVALVCGRRWHALAGFGATLVLSAGVVTLAYGPGIWTAFLDHAGETRRVFEYGRIPFTGSVSSFAAVRLLDGSVALAYAVQGLASLAAAGLVGWLWATDRSPALRYAALAAAMPFAAPVVLFYDLMPLAIAIAWLGVEIRRMGFRPWEKAGLGLAWLITGLDLPIAHLTHLPLGPLAPALVLGLVVARARKTHVAAVAALAGSQHSRE
jgi:alpha-1,2-mannosyltransferase